MLYFDEEIHRPGHLCTMLTSDAANIKGVR